MGVRIDDRKDYPDYNERYSSGYLIKKGSNHITIQLDTLVTSGSNRYLDLAHIYRVYFFMRHPEIKTTFYIDSIKLARSGK